MSNCVSIFLILMKRMRNSCYIKFNRVFSNGRLGENSCSSSPYNTHILKIYIQNCLPLRFYPLHIHNIFWRLFQIYNNVSEKSQFGCIKCEMVVVDVKNLKIFCTSCFIQDMLLSEIVCAFQDPIKEHYRDDGKNVVTHASQHY